MAQIVRNTFIDYDLPKCTPGGDEIKGIPRAWNTDPTMHLGATTAIMAVPTASPAFANTGKDLDESLDETASTREASTNGDTEEESTMECPQHGGGAVEEEEGPLMMPAWNTDEVHLCDLNLSPAPLLPPIMPIGPPGAAAFGAWGNGHSYAFGPGASDVPQEEPIPNLCASDWAFPAKIPTVLQQQHQQQLQQVMMGAAGGGYGDDYVGQIREQQLEQRHAELARELRQIEMEKLALRQRELEQQMRANEMEMRELLGSTAAPPLPQQPSGQQALESLGSQPQRPQDIGHGQVARGVEGRPNLESKPQLAIPNLGSLQHSTNPDACMPCAFLHKDPRGCLHGYYCKFCHLCPAGELKKRKKEKVARLRAQQAAEGQEDSLEATDQSADA